MTIEKELQKYINEENKEKIKELLPLINVEQYADLFLLVALQSSNNFLYDLLINNKEILLVCQKINQKFHQTTLVDIALINGNYKVVESLLNNNLYTEIDIKSIEYHIKTYGNSDYIFLFKNKLVYNYMKEHNFKKFSKLNEVFLTQTISAF